MKNGNSFSAFWRLAAWAAGGLSLVFAASVGTAATPPIAVQWVCAGAFEKSLGRREASVNIATYRERFLAAQRGAARQAIFVFPASYEVMRVHLRSVNQKRFGEREFAEHAALDVQGIALSSLRTAEPAPAGHSSAGLTPENKKQLLTELEEAGINLGTTAGAHIRTERYNIVPSKEGWSELEILVLDGKALLGTDSTLVILSRLDSAKAWGMATPGNPFTFGRNRSHDTFVTSTEFALMRRLGKLYRIPFAVFPLGDRLPIYGNAEVWRAAKDWLQAYEEAPDTTAPAKDPGRC